ncbi:hypothetical protein G7Y89_g8656 [Cudoniella acicularis]|uniref:Heterokaryon incompatibility domain-containing protein n=1 Tax=Cudoniella acicularis TaxID=354080 RepID=A0A8H4W2N8_9HELO|nr:hypothetical protein G7Y89_g8656 [Cudoniella acicularis]
MGNIDSKIERLESKIDELETKRNGPDTNFTGEQFCTPCRSMFGTVKGLLSLCCRGGFRYHSRITTNAGARGGCPLCKIIHQAWAPMERAEFNPGEDCILRAVCAQNPPPKIRKKVFGYPSDILSIGFVFGTVGTDEQFLTIYQLPGDPASDYLTGCLPRSDEFFGEQNIQEVKRRLHTCYSEHKICPKHTVHKLPTTVLDVLSPNPKLHISAPDERGEYVALSYCWGGPQLMTTKDTLQANMAGIALHTLSQTIQDAIHITRKLGVRYLWVDALCIVQDDEASQLKEIDQMGKIYSNAALTISAASAAHATDGFLHKPFTSNGCEIPFLLPDGKFGKVLVVPSQETKAIAFEKLVDIPKYPINYYHWRQQERLMNSVAFRKKNCPNKSPRRGLAARHSLLGLPRAHAFPPPPYLRPRRRPLEMPDRVPVLRSPSVGYDPKHWTSVRGIRGVWATTTRQRQLWETVMTDFSNRSITVEQDRLPALAGIASQFEELSGEQYVAGYWVNCLPELLPWVRKPLKPGENNQPNGELKELKELKEYLVPSWSWIAARQPIVLHPITDVTAEVISAVAEPLHPEARFGRLKSATLILKATILPKDERFVPTWDQKMDNGGAMEDGMVLMKLGMNMMPKTSFFPEQRLRLFDISDFSLIIWYAPSYIVPNLRTKDRSNPNCSITIQNASASTSTGSNIFRFFLSLHRAPFLYIIPLIVRRITYYWRDLGSTETTVNARSPDVLHSTLGIKRRKLSTRRKIVLVSIPAQIKMKRPSVDIIVYAPGAKYVSISHVWSDGLGNSFQNALPSCQSQRLSAMVQDLYGRSDPNTGCIPFWIDTVYCPIAPKDAKDLGITAMRSTYQNADRVLVLDSYLQSFVSEPESGPETEILLRIFFSQWARRLWTLQEGALAQNLYIQLSNHTVNFNDLSPTLTGTRGRTLVSISLIKLQTIHPCL